MSKIQITLNEKQTAKYFKRAKGKTTEEINSDAEPSGSSLTISVEPPFGTLLYLNGDELGEVSFEIIDDE
jgi:hypothetical protein